MSVELTPIPYLQSSIFTNFVPDPACVPPKNIRHVVHICHPLLYIPCDRRVPGGEESVNLDEFPVQDLVQHSCHVLQVEIDILHLFEHLDVILLLDFAALELCHERVLVLDHAFEPCIFLLQAFFFFNEFTHLLGKFGCVFFLLDEVLDVYIVFVVDVD